MQKSFILYLIAIFPSGHKVRKEKFILVYLVTFEILRVTVRSKTTQRCFTLTFQWLIFANQQ